MPSRAASSPIEPIAPVRCFFVSDLHGNPDRYRSLFEVVRAEQPDAVFVGGDFLPSRFGGTRIAAHRFVEDYFAEELRQLAAGMAERFPAFYLIMGNDDERREEEAVRRTEASGLLHYVHERRAPLKGFEVIGYGYVPPTPFSLKDWERYDVSRHVDPGCVAPEDGVYTWPVAESDLKWATIQKDLERLAGDAPLDDAVFLFHAPPYRTRLDRCALDGVTHESVALDVHIGSIAIRRFIEARQPRIALHGHVHESARLSGDWRDRIGRTHLFTAAHDGPELALVRFDLREPAAATRELI